MSKTDLRACKALAFDIFGTVLDLRGSLIGPIENFLSDHLDALVSPEVFWNFFRRRQRLEQYQDSLMQLGHSGYLETTRRAFLYTARNFNIEPTKDETISWMDAWNGLTCFSDIANSFANMRSHYKMAAVSNGDARFIDYLIRERIRTDFDFVFSVETVGVFKPHPAVYRQAVADMGLEAYEVIMVSSNSFDILGARASGMCAAFVNRTSEPYEESDMLPNIETSNMDELASYLA